MSVENAREFAVRMKESEDFRKPFREAGSREKAIELAQTMGFDFTVEELKQVRQEYRAKMEAADELSDEQLDRAAGGSCSCWSCLSGCLSCYWSNVW